jgi:hypothetical protein
MRCVRARKTKRRFRGKCPTFCLSHVQEPEGARVCVAFPEAVHARKSLAEPGMGGTLRGDVARLSRRRRHSGVSRLRPPMDGPKMISAHEPPPGNLPERREVLRLRLPERNRAVRFSPEPPLPLRPSTQWRHGQGFARQGAGRLGEDRRAGQKISGWHRLIRHPRDLLLIHTYSCVMLCVERS